MNVGKGVNVFGSVFWKGRMEGGKSIFNWGFGVCLVWRIISGSVSEGKGFMGMVDKDCWFGGGVCCNLLFLVEMGEVFFFRGVEVVECMLKAGVGMLEGGGDGLRDVYTEIVMLVWNMELDVSSYW